MSDPELFLDDPFSPSSRPLTPRQDRIDAAIERVPPERAIGRLKRVARRGTIGAADSASATPAVGDSPADRMAMIVR